MRFHLQGIPAGEAGTNATLRRMGELVQQSLQEPKLRLLTLGILERGNVPSKAYRRAAAEIFSWVRSHVRYVKDPIGVETVQAPLVTARLRAGDCDDQSVLVAALAMSIGIPARFRVVGSSRDRFVHVYPELHVAGAWLPADTVEKHALGQRVPAMRAEKLYSVEGNEIMHVGLGEGQATGTRTFGVPKRVAESAAYKGAYSQLSDNWRRGRINRRDLESYLQVIDQGNSPAPGSWIEKPIRAAITDFTATVKRKGAYSSKPESVVDGLHGLDGFLGSVWNAAKKVVGGAIKAVTGGGTVEVKMPEMKAPQVIMQTPPAAASAGVETLLKSPITWAALAALILVPTLLARR